MNTTLFFSSRWISFTARGTERFRQQRFPVVDFRSDGGGEVLVVVFHEFEVDNSVIRFRSVSFIESTIELLQVLELMLLKQFTELDIETNQHDYEEVYDKYECYFFSFTLCPLSRTLSGSGLETFLTFQEAPHSISENFKNYSLTRNHLGSK
ncbi:hypothetical protein QVD17_01084 [Tagetes erecta]|uniref:Uncharacterized protein n=1 Tax=Tagetes erecta TaxID=13708 RepID=A0AAD8L943_TARER|nr:hypothetical protein QVD17_01084 [Tagetes erecta]